MQSYLVLQIDSVEFWEIFAITNIQEKKNNVLCLKRMTQLCSVLQFVLLVPLKESIFDVFLKNLTIMSLKVKTVQS